MSSTNKTTYYDLPQFVDNDIFNPLVDDNDAYSKIDTALHNIANAEADDASDIVGIKSRLDSAEGDIDALKTQNGDDALTTTAQTLSGAINELDTDTSSLDSRVDVVEDDINNVNTGLKAKVNAIEEQNGSNALETVATTLSGAVNELYNGGVKEKSIEFDKLSDNAVKTLEDNSLVIFMPNSHVVDTYNNGECTLFISNNKKKTVMYDAGRTDSYTDIKNEMIKNNVSKLNYFILSHYHPDHYANLENLITDGYIDHNTVIYLPRDNSIVMVANQTYVRTLLEGYTIVTPDSSTPLVVEDFTFEFFNCDATDFAYYEGQGVDNGNSYMVCAYVYNKGTSILMTGDLDGQAYDRVCSLGYIHKCDILKVPHHGYSTAKDDRVFLECQPDYAVSPISKQIDLDTTDLLNGSNKFTFLSNMNVPSYITGYGAIYVGISDYGYTLFPNTKKIAGKLNVTTTIYVDDTYTGTPFGDYDHPFPSLGQAVKALRENNYASQVNIRFKTEYIHHDEIVYIRNLPHVNIEGSSTSYFEVKAFSMDRSNVHIRYCRVYNENTTGFNVNSCDLYLRNVSINGNNYDASGEVYGISATYNSNLFLNQVAINTQKACLFLQNCGSIAYFNAGGTGNKVLLTGTNGNNIIFSQNFTIEYETFMQRMQNNVEGPASTISVNSMIGYSTVSPFVYYNKNNAGTEADSVVNMGSTLLQNRIVRVYSANGEIYQFNNVSHGATTPTKVQNAIDATIDPNFAVSVSGNTLTITHKSFVKVEVI